MSLIRIDWSPSPKKLREFGVGLILFSAALGGLMLRRHKPAGPYVLGGGLLLGVLTLAAPGVGRLIYKAWMGFAFVMGTISSYVLLGVIYYAILTPLALVFRWRGRDALRLARPEASTYWVSMESPDGIEAYERLY